MNNNPPCPLCGGTTGIHEHLRSGNIRYICHSQSCKKTFTPGRQKKGRKPIGDRPMTAIERKRRSRQLKKGMSS